MNKKLITRIGAALTVAVTVFSAMARTTSPESSAQQTMVTFNNIISKLQQFYVDSLDLEKNALTGINAMLQDLDPYTQYFTEAEANQFRNDANGEFGGIGVVLTSYNGQTYITDPMPGKPAFKAGLRSGDKVIMVDSVSTRNKPNDFVRGLVRGFAGTPLSITVVRPFVADSVITVRFEREKIQQPVVPFHTVFEPGIGYLEISTFSPDNTAESVRKVLEEFKKEKNLKGIIIDLSDNTGGLITQAVEVASMFLPRGTKVLETRSKGGAMDRTYYTKQDPIFPDIPLAVIINRNTASASELFSGALQDYDRAVLIGQRSFGKGLVQSTMEMPYNGMLKVTTAKYHLPSGRLIQALDYSNRDENGHPGYTPDSLSNIFHTTAGRIVKDGGGLQPEILVNDSLEHPFTVYTLMVKPYMFNFANEWYARHPLPEGKDFEFTDEVWNAFLDSLPYSSIKLDSQSQYLIDKLRETARESGTLNDSIENQLNALAAAIIPEVRTEINDARQDIEPSLAAMIAERYGFSQAMSMMSARYDKGIQEARKILLDPAAYKAMLKAAPAAPQGKKKKK